MPLEEIYLGERLSITEAYNSLLEKKKGIVRTAYDPSGIYQFWEDEFKVCKENKKIVVCRENIYKQEWANSDGGINFYNSLIEKYRNRERVFALYRYRKERVARVLIHQDIPLLANIEIAFLDKKNKCSVKNIKKLTLTFPLKNEHKLNKTNKNPSKSDLINEYRRLRAIEYKEGAVVKFWHGIFQNRISNNLKHKNIRHKMEFSIAGRRIDIASFPEKNNPKVINIYEIKTASDRVECERQSIAQLIDYYHLAIDNNYEVRKLITVGPENSSQGWQGKAYLENEISSKWEYQTVPE